MERTNSAAVALLTNERVQAKERTVAVSLGRLVGWARRRARSHAWQDPVMVGAWGVLRAWSQYGARPVIVAGRGVSHGEVAVKLLERLVLEGVPVVHVPEGDEVRVASVWARTGAVDAVATRRTREAFLYGAPFVWERYPMQLGVRSLGKELGRAGVLSWEQYAEARVLAGDSGLVSAWRGWSFEEARAAVRAGPVNASADWQRALAHVKHARVMPPLVGGAWRRLN